VISGLPLQNEQQKIFLRKIFFGMNLQMEPSDSELPELPERHAHDA
jgi:hypothetical protein